MSVCVYLKKDINWKDVPIPDTSYSLINEPIISSGRLEGLGLGIREFRSAVKNFFLNSWVIPIIKNDDTDLNNRVFYTDESFSRCLDYDWIIPMDDDDDLGTLPVSLFQSTESDVICWTAYEYDFITGHERISSYVKEEDCPPLVLKRNNIPLLPGCYAISKRVAEKALETGSVGSIVNFFSALNYFQLTESKISFLKDTFTTRPYTHFCEYYLYGDDAPTQPIFNYTQKHEFLDIIKGIYLLGKSRI